MTEAAAPTAPKALAGIRVVDFATGVAGPHASLLLAHHGADVVKIEPPEGDWSRALGRSYGDLSAFATYYNRGKRSIALDLKTAEGRALAFRMASEADVVVEAFRPGVMERLGLDYERLAKVKPDLVFLAVSGFGQTGPNAQVPATDTVIQGYSGFMSLNSDADGTPQRFPAILIDVVTGLYGFQAVMAALMARFRYGRGAFLDCSLMQSAVALQAPALMKYQFEQGKPGVMYVPLGVLATKDGHLSISVNRDRHFVDFCGVMGRDDLARDPRFDHLAGRIEREPELMAIIRAEFLKRTTDAWAALLQSAGLLHARIRTYDDVLEDPETARSGLMDWIAQSGFDQPIPIPNIPAGARASDYGRLTECPHVGEHSREILSEMGWRDADIEIHVRRGIVATRQIGKRKSP